jgi:hypothetical protein
MSGGGMEFLGQTMRKTIPAQRRNKIATRIFLFPSSGAPRVVSNIQFTFQCPRETKAGGNGRWSQFLFQL